DVPNDAIKLMLFLYSLKEAARIWYEKEPSLKDSRRHLERLGNVDSLNATASGNLLTIEKTCVICGGAHAYYDCIATDSNQPSVCAATGSYNQVSLPNRASHQKPPPGFTPVQTIQIGTLPSNTVPNPKGEMKGVTTHSFLAYEGPSIPTNSPLEKAVEQDTEEITKKSILIVKELPEKLKDPGKFLIPCDFPGIDVCHPLADLGASINIMPLSIWKKLSLLELNPTRMTLELVDRSFTHPKGVAEDEPIVKSSLPTLTPFGDSDFFLEEIEDFLDDESIPTGIENSLYDTEGDILYLEKLLNEDPFQLPPMDLKQEEKTKAKSSIEEPPELELKELPSHLEYAFLEESDKLPVIIAKDIKDV
nr:reverse transcriptase domain-containing protein [Tanacetum cinerariifolium]